MKTPLSESAPYGEAMVSTPVPKFDTLVNSSGQDDDDDCGNSSVPDSSNSSADTPLQGADRVSDEEADLRHKRMMMKQPPACAEKQMEMEKAAAAGVAGIPGSATWSSPGATAVGGGDSCSAEKEKLDKEKAAVAAAASLSTPMPGSATWSAATAPESIGANIKNYATSPGAVAAYGDIHNYPGDTKKKAPKFIVKLEKTPGRNGSVGDKTPPPPAALLTKRIAVAGAAGGALADAEEVECERDVVATTTVTSQEQPVEVDIEAGIQGYDEEPPHDEPSPPVPPETPPEVTTTTMGSSTEEDGDSSPPLPPDNGQQDEIEDEESPRLVMDEPEVDEENPPSRENPPLDEDDDDEEEDNDSVSPVPEDSAPSHEEPSPAVPFLPSPSPAVEENPNARNSNNFGGGSSNHQEQPRRDGQDPLPLAVPVPEPPSFGRGTSYGSYAGSTVVSQSVVQAQPLEEWDEEKQPKNCCPAATGRGWLSPTQWAVGALLLVILIVVGVVIGVTQAKDGGDDSNGTVAVDGTNETSLVDSNNTTEAPATPPPTVGSSAPPVEPEDCRTYPSFYEGLHFLTLQALDDPCSPQSRANTWMMEDPNRESYDDERQLQRFSLATLYHSTGGRFWKRNDLWLDYDKDECQWYNQVDEDLEGPICDEESHIIKLNLARNDLKGVLPVELFFFPALASLDLSHNGLYGTAPTMFAGARYLERLVLSSNQLTGQFTAELGFVASKLAILHNDDNLFTGAVPGLLRLLPNLYDLNITGNQYTGALPGSLSQLSNTLVNLEVAANSITGGIPPELGMATHLLRLDVGRNPDLQGNLPTELAALRNLTSLNIAGTGVSGSPPNALCELQQQGQLDLQADCGGKFQCCNGIV